MSSISDRTAVPVAPLARVAREGSLEVEWRGEVPYAEALVLQEDALEARRSGASGDRLLLLEHPPVITLGRSTKPENLLSGRESLAAAGIDVFEIARGGDVTYHAPGQLVGYLIVDLDARGDRDVHAFLRRMEGALEEALAALGVPARTLAGMTGVFVEDARSPEPPRKIASIGIGVRRWVTWHGFALNVDIDLAGFENIVPCGLAQVEMTSVAQELGVAAPAGLRDRAVSVVRESFLAAFTA